MQFHHPAMSDASTAPIVLQFVKRLQDFCPDVEATLEKGGKGSDVWWIDLSTAATHVVVQWSSAAGFRLEEAGSGQPVFGAVPTEQFQTLELTLKRMEQLLTSKSSAEVGGAKLRELRELRGFSQADLGETIGIKQAAISRAERRSDIQLGTLAAFLHGLGGELEVTARFPDCVLPMHFKDLLSSAMDEVIKRPARAAAKTKPPRQNKPGPPPRKLVSR